jgi:3-keto-5-aminohexanoate cleavage enzyme
MDPLIISAALAGGRAGSKNPHHPTSPEEIAEAAVQSWKEGAAIVHIHARDDGGQHSGDVEHFRRSVDAIRAAGCDVLINLTTSFGGTTANDPAVRMGPLSLKPEIASFDAGTLNFGENVFVNSRPFLRHLASAMKEQGVKPEIEVFDAGMIATALDLVRDGLIVEPPFFQMVLGVQGGAPATAKHLLHMVDCLPAGVPWSVCALGRDQLPMNLLAISLGGHARTGLEDNSWYRKGEYASNAQLVARVRQCADLMGRPVATVAEARTILALPAAV